MAAPEAATTTRYNDCRIQRVIFMPESLIMHFPILQPGCADFMQEVLYEVVATKKGREITITHTLVGQSFINQLIQRDEAQFSVRLLFRDSSERQHAVCKNADIKFEDGKIVGKQIIKSNFDYFPTIMPSVVILKDDVITATDKASGLNEFWQHKDLNIPKYSRIALFPKIESSDNEELSSLLKIDLNEDFDKGEMEVQVNEHANGSEAPVTLLCGQDVYDQLRQIRPVDPRVLPESKSTIESLRLAIVTNILCALYAYMQQLHVGDGDVGKYEESGVLFYHLKKLEEVTGKSWKDEDFSPSLMATKMLPYMLDKKILNIENGYE